MREADLARFRPAAATDDGRHRRGVMRFAEGAGAADAAAVDQPRQRMDHRGLERLGRGQRRQDTGDARGEHRLARPRRPDKDRVVPPRRRDLERALGAFLSLDVQQVARRRRARDIAGAGGADGLGAREMADRGREAGGGDDVRGIDPCGLRPGRLGAQERPAFRRGRHRRGQGARDRHQRAGQRQLSEGDGAGGIVGRDDVERRKQRQRDGQVEMRSLLRQVGGREVDRDPLRWQRDRHRRQGRAHTFARLGHRLVRQADDREGRHAGRYRALHLDHAGLDPLERDGIGMCDHGLSPSRRPCDAGVDERLTIAVFVNYIHPPRATDAPADPSGRASDRTRRAGPGRATPRSPDRADARRHRRGPQR